MQISLEMTREEKMKVKNEYSAVRDAFEAMELREFYYLFLSLWTIVIHLSNIQGMILKPYSTELDTSFQQKVIVVERD